MARHGAAVAVTSAACACHLLSCAPNIRGAKGAALEPQPHYTLCRSSATGYGVYARTAGLTMTAKRTLRVTKWLATVPAVAVCTQCGREFKVPLLSLKRTSEAQESLRKQFAEHKCPNQVAEK
jgi:hypothetical protein